MVGMVFGGILSDETYFTDCGSYAEGWIQAGKPFHEVMHACKYTLFNTVPVL